MTATELYRFRAEQVMDSISYYNIQHNGNEKYIYNQMPDLLEYMDTFVSECMDTDAVSDDEEFILDGARNETLKICLDEISRYYFEVLESRNEFEKKNCQLRQIVNSSDAYKVSATAIANTKGSKHL